jgi:predicted O-methyltransferase YrrM
MPALTSSKNARSWDSFRKTLSIVMAFLKPRIIFEYGPGESTKIMSKYDFVEVIESVEHDEAWYYKWKDAKIDKCILTLEKDLDKYPYTPLNNSKAYDLIFVDGRERPKCLEVARNILSHNGIVILHDAERAEYQDEINKFKYIFFTDHGNTCVMTDNTLVEFSLDDVLEGV